MKAWHIFSHSVRQVFGNLTPALQVSLVPFLGIALVVAVFVGLVASTRGGGDIGGGKGLFGVLVAVPLFLLYLGFLVSIAVNWHRFILLGAPTSWMPSFRFDRIFAYFLRTIVVTVAMMVGGFLIFLPVGLIGGAFSGQRGAFAVVLAILAFLLIITLGWRLSASMPGAALDQGRGLGDAWSATRGAWPTLLLLSLIYFAAAFAVGLLAGVIGLIPIIGFLVDLVVQWLAMMIGLSILTTLYGHYIEGRPLV